MPKRESAPYGSLRSQGRPVETSRQTRKTHERMAEKIPYAITLPSKEECSEGATRSFSNRASRATSISAHLPGTSLGQGKANFEVAARSRGDADSHPLGIALP